MNDKSIVLSNILDTEGLENSVEPVMLIDLTPTLALLLIEQKVKEYSQSLIDKKAQLEQERFKKIADLLRKRNGQNQKE
jgi:transcriptional regulator of heat shock response